MQWYFIRCAYGADEKAVVDNGGEYAIMETRKEDDRQRSPLGVYCKE